MFDRYQLGMFLQYKGFEWIDLFGQRSILHLPHHRNSVLLLLGRFQLHIRFELIDLLLERSSLDQHHHNHPDLCLVDNYQHHKQSG